MALDDKALITTVLRTEDYFEILGVDKSVTVKELTKSYRKLALKLHPDKCSLEGAEEAFKKVSQAFACLKNEDSRKHYEMFGKERGPGGIATYENVDPFDMFHDVFAAMQKAQQEKNGGQMPGAYFSSAGGATFVSINGSDLVSLLPTWAQPIYNAVPGQVWVMVFVVLIYQMFSFFLKYIFYFLTVGYLVPRQFRSLALGVVLGLALMGTLG